MTIHDLVQGARDRFMHAGISANLAALDAEVLARQVLGWDRARFLTDRDEIATSMFLLRYEPLVARRERREPVSYILGTREFWGLPFEVGPDVLIPRQETEFIIEETLALAGRDGHPLIVDVGTGSGCIAISLALEIPGARVIATDLSRHALGVARRNAARHGVSNRITFVETSFLDDVEGPVDIIVSNPPYVPSLSEPGLTPEVRDYEPAVALFGGEDGLDGLRSVLEGRRKTIGARRMARHGVRVRPGRLRHRPCRPRRRARSRQDSPRPAGHPAHCRVPKGAGRAAMNGDCLFCKIVAGIIPVKPLYDDAELIAIQDINPQAPLHALIIPKIHIGSLNELTAEHEALVGRMFRRAAAPRETRAATTCAATGLSSTRAPKPAKACFTSICTSSPDGRWAGLQVSTPFAFLCGEDMTLSTPSRFSRLSLHYPAQLHETPDNRHVVSRGLSIISDRRTRTPRIPTRARAVDVLREAVADHQSIGGRHPRQLQGRFKDAWVRLHEAVLRRGDGDVDKAIQLEVLLERIEAAVRVRDEPDHDIARGESLERRRHVVIEKKVLAQRPFLIDLRRAWLDSGTGAPHRPDDVGRVVDEDLRVVDGVLLAIEDVRALKSPRQESAPHQPRCHGAHRTCDSPRPETPGQDR